MISSSSSRKASQIYFLQGKLLPLLSQAYTLGGHIRFSGTAQELQEFDETLDQSVRGLQDPIRPVHARAQRRQQGNQRWSPLSLPLTDRPVEIEQLVNVIRRKGTSADLVKCLDELGICLTHSHVHETLKSLDDVGSAIRFFYWAGQQPNFSHDVVTYFSLVNSLARAKEFSKIWDLVSEMHRLGFELTDCFFNITIKAYGEMGNCEDAIRTLGDMSKFGVVPTAYSYNTALSVLIKSQKLDLAMEVYDEMLQAPSLGKKDFAFGMMIHGLCEAGRPQDALKVADDMKKRDLALGLISWTALINGFCKAGDVNKGLELLSEMKDAGVEPNVITHSAIISGFCKVGKVDDAVAHVSRMKSTGCAPNAVTYIVLSHGFCKAGRIDDGIQCMKVLAGGRKWDAVMYHIFVAGYSKLGRMDEACSMFKEMTDNGHWANASTYGILIQGLCKTGRVKEACTFFNDMKAKKCGPNAAVYKVIIQGLSTAGLKDEAMKMFNAMLSQGYEATSSTCSVLLGCLCRAGSLDDAMKTFMVMLNKNCPVVAPTYNVLLKGLCERNKVDSAHQLLNNVLARGFPPEPCSYNILITGAAKAGDVDKGLMFFSEMQRKGCVPDLYTYSPLYQALFKARRASALLDVLRDMTNRHVLPSPFVFTILIMGLCKMNKLAEACDFFFKMVEDGFKLTDSNVNPTEMSERNILRSKVFIPLLNHLQDSDKVTEMASLWEWVLDKGLFRWIEHFDAKLEGIS